MELKSELSFRAARGTLILEAVDEIPTNKNSGEFGIKSQKRIPEIPYRYRVVSVGLPRPFDGVMVESEVLAGDIISLIDYNQTQREGAESAGFLIDGNRYYAADFRDVLIVWETEQEHILKYQKFINERLDRSPH